MITESGSPLLRLRQIQALLIVVARDVADRDTSEALFLIAETLGTAKDDLECLLQPGRKARSRN